MRDAGGGPIGSRKVAWGLAACWVGAAVLLFGPISAASGDDASAFVEWLAMSTIVLGLAAVLGLLRVRAWGYVCGLAAGATGVVSGVFDTTTSGEVRLLEVFLFALLLMGTASAWAFISSAWVRR